VGEHASMCTDISGTTDLGSAPVALSKERAFDGPNDNHRDLIEHGGHVSAGTLDFCAKNGDREPKRQCPGTERLKEKRGPH
jgi:hypothetical protein